MPEPTLSPRSRNEKVVGPVSGPNQESQRSASFPNNPQSESSKILTRVIENKKDG